MNKEKNLKIEQKKKELELKEENQRKNLEEIKKEKYLYNLEKQKKNQERIQKVLLRNDNVNSNRQINYIKKQEYAEEMRKII